MATTVDNIQARVAAIVDQDQDTSNIASDDYSLRLNYINRRERVWAETGKWSPLAKEYNSIASTSTGNASVSLPADFRALSAYPRITYDGTHTSEFPEIRLQDKTRFDEAVDQYVIVLGNPHTGYNLFVNPATTNRQMTSGASIKVFYYSTPTSLASPADVVTCPNPDYLIQGVIADVWEAREDTRFQQAKVEANLILQNMLEFENTPSEASYSDIVRTQDQTRYGFRMGRD